MGIIRGASFRKGLPGFGDRAGARGRIGGGIVSTGTRCQTGTMRRMNLRDVPDDVYTALAEAAEANRQSLSAFVVDRLTEVARVARLGDYVGAYTPPAGTGISLEDAANAVREVREAS